MERMNWVSLLVEERFGVICKKSEDGRSQFQKDIDRITFSSSFRRLGRKTQVHPLNENDHIHTRLSHSLEVACVGRSLGVLVGNFLKKKGELPPTISALNIGEIVQAACLAHDIGNPPFGHGGEEVIRKWFEESFEKNGFLHERIAKRNKEKDFTCFDGNAMAFRVATYKEYYMSDGGMRLTYPTLGAMLKYPWTSQFVGKKKKFSCFQSEIINLNHIAMKLGLIQKYKDDHDCRAKYVRHPLAFLVEAADDICYKILDIEDAVELKLLEANFVEKQFRHLLNLEDFERKLLDAKNVSRRTKNALIRGKTMEIVIADVIDEFVRNYDKIMTGDFDIALTDTEKKESCKAINESYKSVVEDVYTSKRKELLEIGAFSTIGNLLEIFAKAAYHTCCKEECDRPYKTKKILELIKNNLPQNFSRADPNFLYNALMLALDYVTGMTDHYATEINRKIIGINL
jgi:dGTPase